MEFWEEVGKDTETKWKIDASVDEEDFGYAQNNKWEDPDQKRLLFQVASAKSDITHRESRESVWSSETCPMNVFGGL